MHDGHDQGGLSFGGRSTTTPAGLSARSGIDSELRLAATSAELLHLDSVLPAIVPPAFTARPPTRVEQTERVIVDLTEAPGPERIVHVPGRYERWLKPAIDRIGAAVLLVVTVPLMAAAAVAVLISMGRPVIYRQARVGRDGDEFTIYKFRTMVADRRVAQVPFDGPDRRKAHKVADDPRITRVGHLIRKLSLDELPQLWNVLRGEMSLVGPRPEMPEIVKTYEPWQHDRHQVKPGLTGIWQIMARSNGKLMHEATEFDIRYLHEVSIRTDLKILVRTIPAALGKRKGF